MKRRSFFFKTLKVQITGYYLVTSLFLIFIMALVLYFSISNIMLQAELESTALTVEQSGQYIEIYIDKLKSLSDVITKSPITLDYLTTHEPVSRTQLIQTINTILASDPYLASVILVSKSGEVISNEASLDMTISEDMMNESWYVSAANSRGMPVLTSLRQQEFSMDQESWVISVGQKIVNSEAQNIGVLLLDIKYKVIENYLGNITGGYAFILDENNDVVYHPNSDYFDNEDLKAELLDIQRMADGYDQQKNILTHHYKIKGTHWVMIGISTLNDLKMVRRQMFEIVLLVSLLLLGIVLGSGWIIATRITKPFRRLEDAMKDIETGLHAIAVDEQGCYEVESLTKHFNEMSFKIHELLNNIKENEKYLRSYEINVLYSQINPHFLYNTLDTIVWMAEFNDSDKVVAITKALAQFFRLSLSSGEEMIPLSDEVEHVRQYLFIQSYRYGDQLEVTFDIDPELETIKVPKIIIQPIVENAIYHGIRENSNLGKLVIKTTKDNDHLVILIKDNGIGFNPDHYSKSEVKLGGVGIANVDQRIKLYYGENYGVQIVSKIHESTEVRLVLPL